jgi:membrane-bound lytic murein transglycosylase B
MGSLPHPLRPRRTLLAATLAFASPWALARRGPIGGAAYGSEHAAVLQWCTEVAARQGWPRRWLIGRLAQARRLAAVQRLIMPAPAGQPKSWRAYRERFVERERIAVGLDFWRRHTRWFDEAEARYGVEASIVLAILGVETYYGRVMGEFRTIDALATLGFDFPAGRSDRSAFFRAELEELFAWCARDGHDPLTPRGSYAGAIGLPQFMPGSINRYAVDFDGDGRVDLHAAVGDAVGSVARYLAEHGWRRAEPTHFELREVPTDAQALATLRAPDIKPTFSAAQMAELGAVLEEAAQGHAGALAFVELENGTAPPSHVAGAANFWVITRYNWSAYYALAVIELARTLRAAR